MSDEGKFIVRLVVGSFVGIIAFIALWLWLGPIYRVWSAQKDGEAILAHAHAARMVLVTQAEAEMEAASKRAKAIEIVGQAAQDFPEYRQQEFIGAFAEALHSGKIQQIIYVPTEAGIPILEAGRRRDPQ